MSVSEPKQKKNRKRCVLTEDGRKKLNKALDEKYEKKYDIVELAHNSGINRDTMSKILNKPQEAVVRKSLYNLFSFLGIDLEETDYDNPPKTQASSNRHSVPPTSLITDSPIPSNLDSEKLKCALQQLNYVQQKFLFDEGIIQVKPAAAFLIHGKPNYGQRWLVNLLKYKVPYHSNAWQKSLYIKPHRRDIQTLWQNLAQQLGTSPSPEEIAEKLYQQWQTATVILVIHEVDLIAGSCLKQFINEFWQPLVNKVNNGVPPQHPYRLLLFLVDNTNSKSKLETSLSLVAQPDRNQPHVPLALQELEPFNKNVIETWVGVQFELLLQLWQGSDSIEKVMQTIVERDNQPISVLGKICECFELDWEQDIVRGFAL